MSTDDPTELSHPIARSGPLALVLELFAVVGAFVALSVAAGDPATACGWCATNPFDVAVRDLLVTRDPIWPARLSHALSMIAAPLLALGALIVPAVRARRFRHAAQDVAILVNAFVLVTGLADGVKKLTDRQRPGVHFGRVRDIEASHAPIEHYLSFFSGDTAWAFVFGATAAALAHQRGYRHARVVAQVGAALGVGTALLRVAADMHWMTDVLMGAAVGTAVGVGLPSLFHRRAT